ncbi:helix-turn-helix domain-containing protein [Streptococcus equi subsp. zooepidemicus]|uniref:helix-turn-helix domain-containing protein n=1 Tax=Streptococcus equi TaxID=1336 RepID=UPI001E5501A3|nr:helix-turn-helix transcriptional regulator [Streptococcus equi]MCD3380031.1 helix-turn-helix domain-containing protein [Streptococcus equi subsp. zooepidemicus]MCD3409304.1 helix-turn-helix domain-containing protein [Streptococcus equi subsp. zooepidemicus]MCD3464838.1 helix-turn-helix domain-containing protein [Streptococcus equi subsp. zooepidemicus]HEL0663258.1 helix-turn-helix transcriptional regulator [Streptococcus equi subsp. zooepidemicus]HEL1205291.1 helix-turn-helix transcriptiona
MFAKRLKALRLKAGFTQKELAEKFNIRQQTYAQWESGRTKPRSATLEKFASFFNVTTDYLLGKTDIKTPEQSELDQANFLFRTTVSELKLTEEQQEQFKKDIEAFIEQRRKAFEEK